MQKIQGVIDSVLAKTLQCVVVPQINKWTCQKDYVDRYVVTSRMTCYGFQEGGIDACQVRYKCNSMFIIYIHSHVLYAERNLRRNWPSLSNLCQFSGAIEIAHTLLLVSIFDLSSYC